MIAVMIQTANWRIAVMTTKKDIQFLPVTKFRLRKNSYSGALLLCQRPIKSLFIVRSVTQGQCRTSPLLSLCSIPLKTNTTVHFCKEKEPLGVNCAGWKAFSVHNSLYGILLKLLFTYILVEIYRYWRHSLLWDELSHDPILISAKHIGFR